ncbi:PREDICTED: protein FAM205A-like [Elephantulus edwardii]|uniref:protein FAM205A-like n=1 Tax=Elephantulus edwardii TaxID=28737 RepID=UPI0003F0722F|nr:PREDICTED: protein FAM205A-like [Elephantulus edwardii]
MPHLSFGATKISVRDGSAAVENQRPSDIEESGTGLEREQEEGERQSGRPPKGGPRLPGLGQGRANPPTPISSDRCVSLPSQEWLPPEGSVRQLLCEDPCCPTCNDAALEIQQLLSSESILPPSGGQPSPCIEMSSSVSFEVSMPTVSFGQTLEWHSQQPRECLISPEESHLMDQNSLRQTAAPSTSAISSQDYWTGHLDFEQGFQLPDVPSDPGIMSSPMTTDFRFPVTHEEILNNSNKYIQEKQDQQYSNYHVPLLSLDTEFADVTHPLQVLLPANLPFLSSEVLRLLEVHVKKWTHFQRWGLPRRVEESLRQLMPKPPLLYKPGDSQPVSFIMNETSHACVETIEKIPHYTGSPWVGAQPTQAFWISEWSITDPKRCHNYQKAPDPLAVALHPPAFKVLRGLNIQPVKQAQDSRDYLKKKQSQLFCGLPCLHSESLVNTFMDSLILSTNRSMSQPSLSVPFFLKEPSFLPLLPNRSAQSAPPSSPPSPIWKSPLDHQQTQIHFPLLTLAEYETLEWHLLQKQLQLRWDLPTVFLRSQSDQNSMLFESYDTAQTPETMQASWLTKPVSVLTKELLFFPDQSRRLLEIHLQKKLIYYHWGLPQKIKQSIQSLWSPAKQQPLPWSNIALQPEASEANGVSDSISLTLAPGSLPLSHLLIQAKAILQSHIHSKCWQIRQGNIPNRVSISWDCRISGSLAVTPLPCIFKTKCLELQAAADPDLHQKVLPWIPTGIKQQQGSPDAVVKETKLPQPLPEEAIKKLEAALQHKYSAFFSRLPALYYVALSKTLAPKIPNQSIITEKISESVQITTEPLTEMISYAEQCTSYVTGFEKYKTSTESTLETTIQEQEKKTVEVAPREGPAATGLPNSLKATALSKLNFHLKRKVLEIHLGIPAKVRESQKQIAAFSEKVYTRESLRNLANESKRSLHEQLISLKISQNLDPKWIHLKGQLVAELKGLLKSQTQAAFKRAPGSAQWVSKISQRIRDQIGAQVLCARAEIRGNSPSLEETWYHKSQSLHKSKDATQVSMLAKSKEPPGKFKPAVDHGEGDAGFGFPSAKENRGSAKDQRPARTRLDEMSQGPWQRFHSLDLVTTCQQNLQPCRHLKLPELLSGVLAGKEYKKNNVKGSQDKVNIFLEPGKVLGTALPVVSQASQNQPLSDPLMEGYSLNSQTLRNELGQMKSGHTYKNFSLSEYTLNKMKHALNDIKPNPNCKVDKNPKHSLTEKVTKTRKRNAEKPNADPAKGPVGRTKTEKTTAYLKTQSFASEKHVGLILKGPQAPENQLRYRFHQVHSASVLGHPHYCPRHCPYMAYATHPGISP